jgi:hypothetical protein
MKNKKNKKKRKIKTNFNNPVIVIKYGFNPLYPFS